MRYTYREVLKKRGCVELKDEELERIVRQYGRELLMRAYALLCDWHEAEDTVQDTFAAAYLHRGGLGELERAWLYKVVTNKCLSRMRKRRPLSLNELGEGAVSVTDSYDAGYSPAVIRALSRLKPAERAAVLWRVEDGLEYAEIAGRLHMSEAAARKRCERARKRLAEYLRDYEKEESR